MIETERSSVRSRAERTDDCSGAFYNVMRFLNSNQPPLVRRIEVRVLPHAALHLFALFFEVEHCFTVAVALALDFFLGAVENSLLFRMLAVGVVFVARGDFLRFLRTVRFFEDFVFKRQILTVAAGVALSSAASDELAVDAR